MKRRIYSLAAAATTFVFCSCTTPWVTNTPRSAVEQYLLSATIERGVKCVDFGKFAGKKAFMDYDYFAPQVDKAYAQGVLEMQLSQAGIVITRKQEEADVIVQPLCGVLGTDYSKFFIGTPQLPIPVPNTDVSFAIPEIPIFSKYTAERLRPFLIQHLQRRRPQAAGLVCRNQFERDLQQLDHSACTVLVTQYVYGRLQQSRNHG